MKSTLNVKIASKFDAILKLNMTQKFAIWSHFRYQKKVINKLSPLFHDLLSNYKDDLTQSHGKIGDTVWMMWWQGKEEMPPLINACYQQARKIYGDSVVVISKDNYMKYTNISPTILEKFSKDQLSLTHFSDVLRVNLLYENGGLWADSTIFMTDRIDKKLIGTANFFSVRKKPGRIYNKYITKDRWAVYFMASSAKSSIFKVLVEMYNIYYDTYDEVFEYFLLDYLIYFVYKYDISGFRKMIDDLPVTNSDIFLLESFMNKPTQVDRRIVIEDDTFLNKLSLKKQHQTSYKGKKTFYAMLIDGSISNVLKNKATYAKIIDNIKNS